MLFEEKLIFFPELYPIGDWQPVIPADVSCDDVFFMSEGNRLHSWFIKPKFQCFDGALLICHGNAGNITSRFPKAASLASLGVPVLLFDYRSYGKSDVSRLSEQAVYADSEAAWNYLRQFYDEGKIIVHGVSLGGGPAGWLACRHDPLALVLESTFTCIPDMCKEMYPYIPRFLVGTQFNTLQRVGALELPKLFIHGDQDDVVPFWMGEKLDEQACEPKTFVRISGGMHSDLLEVAKAGYLEAFEVFFEQNFKAL